MPKVFFLGCNHDQVPYLNAARDLGFRVVATDLNPGAPGAELADAFYPIGYTDTAGLIRIAEKESMGPEDKIFTAAAHFAYEGAAALAKVLGLPFVLPESIDTCLDKTKFYQLLQKTGIAVPTYTEITGGQIEIPNKEKGYYLKSDYGKTPNYCYRIQHGTVPQLPKKFDPFFRRAFLLQEEVPGAHYRINLYHDQVAVFYKFTDTAAAPIRYLGTGQKELVEKLNLIRDTLGLKNYLTKFDVITTADTAFVIDLGLDPPMRLKLLCDHLGFDFAEGYTRYYLKNDPSKMPLWADICKPMVLHGLAGKGFSFINLE